METLQPKLRFPEFSGNWEKKKLGDISKNGMYGMNSSAIEFDGVNKYLRITDIDEESRRFIPKPLVTPYGEIEEKFKLKFGDIVFTRTGASVGKTYLYNTNDGNLLFAGFLIKFSIVCGNPYFIFIQTLTESYNKWVLKMSMRSGQPGINAEECKELVINFPSLQEQTKIASFLTAIDTKINQLTQKKDLLEKYKKGIMQKIFNQELRFKDENGKDYWAWEEKSLGEIGEIITGKTPSTGNSDLWNGKIQFVTPTDIDNKKYQFETVRYIKELPNTKVLPLKSIMFTCIASIGKMSMSIQPCVTNQQINSIIPNNKYDNEFVYYALLNIVDFIKSTQSTNTLPIINKTEFSKFQINIPKSKEEQTKIANFLSAIDDKINQVAIQLDKTTAYKKGLLQQMFV